MPGQHSRDTANGSAGRQITHDGRSLNPVWGRLGIAFDREFLRRRAEPAYQLWMMAGDGGGGRLLAAPAVPPLREGFVPVDFSGNGRLLLANWEGQDTSQAWLLPVAGGRPTPLGGDLVGAGLSRDGANALVQQGEYLASANDTSIETVPVAGASPQLLVARAAQPSSNACGSTATGDAQPLGPSPSADPPPPLSADATSTVSADAGSAVSADAGSAVSADAGSAVSADLASTTSADPATASVGSWGHGAWSWFGDPRAVYVAGQYDEIFVGWISWTGDITIGAYDPQYGVLTTSVIGHAFTTITHSSPSILVEPDQRLTVFWSAHNGKKMYYRSTLRPEDISAWGPLQHVPSNVGGALGYTYPNPVLLRDEANRSTCSGAVATGAPITRRGRRTGAGARRAG